ncbi:hypothetical protein ACGVWS_11105 [Enterobacteriaceae bacterium LUAb1]
MLPPVIPGTTKRPHSPGSGMAPAAKQIRPETPAGMMNGRDTPVSPGDMINTGRTSERQASVLSSPQVYHPASLSSSPAGFSQINPGRFNLGDDAIRDYLSWTPSPNPPRRTGNNLIPYQIPALSPAPIAPSNSQPFIPPAPPWHQPAVSPAVQELSRLIRIPGSWDGQHSNTVPWLLARLPGLPFHLRVDIWDCNISPPGWIYFTATAPNAGQVRAIQLRRSRDHYDLLMPDGNVCYMHADGDCFYHAAQQWLWQQGVPFPHVQQLRQALADIALEHAEELEPLLVRQQHNEFTNRMLNDAPDIPESSHWP